MCQWVITSSCSFSVWCKCGGSGAMVNVMVTFSVPILFCTVHSYSPKSLLDTWLITKIDVFLFGDLGSLNITVYFERWPLCEPSIGNGFWSFRQNTLLSLDDSKSQYSSALSPSFVLIIDRWAVTRGVSTTNRTKYYKRTSS